MVTLFTAAYYQGRMRNQDHCATVLREGIGVGLWGQVMRLAWTDNSQMTSFSANNTDRDWVHPSGGMRWVRH